MLDICHKSQIIKDVLFFMVRPVEKSLDYYYFKFSNFSISGLKYNQMRSKICQSFADMDELIKTDL